MAFSKIWMAPVKRKLPNPFFFDLNLGSLPVPAARSLLLQPPEEVGIGLVQVAQGFLWGAFGDRVHPGQFALLQHIQFPVQVDGGGDALAFLIGFDLASQSPVVCPACCSRMPGAGGFLGIVQIQLGLVGSQDQHRTIVLQWNCF